MRPDDPFGAYRFRLNMGNIEVAGFSECTGLEMETKIFEYREGGRNATSLKFPESTSAKNVVLKQGVSLSYELFDWYIDIAGGQFKHANQRPSAHTPPTHSADNAEQDNARKISVAMVDERGEVHKEWRLKRAFPIKWTGPDFKATDSSVAFESIELAHEGLEPLRS